MDESIVSNHDLFAEIICEIADTNDPSGIDFTGFTKELETSYNKWYYSSATASSKNFVEDMLSLLSQTLKNEARTR